MRRSVLAVLGVLAAAVVLAAGASSAIAGGTITIRTAAGPLETPVKVVTSSSNFTFESIAGPTGSWSCEGTEMAGGFLAGNGTAEPGAVVNEAAMTGCTSSTYGAIAVQPAKLQWDLYWNHKGTGHLRGHPNGFGGSTPIVFVVTLLSQEGPNNKCTLEMDTLKWTFTPGTEGAPLPITLVSSEQILKLNKTAPETSELCWRRGTVTNTFTSTVNGEIVESEAS
jgi:hypothetical protein